ncbi:hypothetical protein DJ495_16845 [Raoultella ornithinolytica]|nr:hypothetical protein DJ495_16845 [Raoultella ornithinolytica]
MTRFFWFIAGQGEPVNGGWRERGFAFWRMFLWDIPFTIFLFPALQANDPGNPALRQEHGRKRRGASRTGRRTKTPGAFLNDASVGPGGVSPMAGTNKAAKGQVETGRLSPARSAR